MSWAELSEGRDAPPAKLAWLRWTLAALAAAVVAALALPYFARLDGGHDRRNACGNHLHQIGMACASYSGDNDECYPDRLDQLYPDYVDNAKIFSCPAKPSTWQDFERRRATAESSNYVLLPGMRDDMPADFIAAYEKPGQHRSGGFHVMYIGARVEWWDQSRAAELEKRLAGQREKIRSWRPAAKSGQAVKEPAP